MFEEEDSEECETCDLKDCPGACFNNHKGSMTALRKVFDSDQKHVYEGFKNGN